MDSRRGDFRRWLDYNGVLDAFTKLFVSMFEEEKWPEDPIEYTKEFFKATPQAEIDAAVEENKRLKEELDSLEKQIAETTQKLEENGE